MEGVLLQYLSYQPNERIVHSFIEDLAEYCRKNSVELFLVSGYYEKVAKKKLNENSFNKYFDENHFLFVNDYYISSKAEADKDLHKFNLETNPEFNDSYFKQIIIQDILKQKKLSHECALLLGNDIWLDGYYTIRFSKIDFAIFEENILDRGKPVNNINGLAYFSLDFDSVEQLIESFPLTNHSSLDKHVFESMKKVFVGDSFVEAVKKGMIQKMNKK
jgi:hypothetical protein